jgi:hypothetical protein
VKRLIVFGAGHHKLAQQQRIAQGLEAIGVRNAREGLLQLSHQSVI